MATDKISLVEHGQHARQLGRVILKIAVQGADERSLRPRNAGPDGRALTPIADVPETGHRGIALLMLLNGIPSAVGGGIIDQDQLPGPRFRCKRITHLRDQGGDILDLVKYGNDDDYLRNHGPRLTRSVPQEPVAIGRGVAP